MRRSPVIFSPSGFPPAAALLLLSMAAGSVAPACGVRRVTLPAGSGTPYPGFEEALREAAGPCAGVRTLTAELAVSGRAAGTRLRGRVIAGLERPGQLRLEGVAPFGAPIFTLAARAGSATLLFERDNQVLREAPTDEVLGALTGVALTADDLCAVLAGCVAADLTPTAGAAFDGGWLRIALAGEALTYLRQRDSIWRIEAGSIGDVVVEYDRFEGRTPREVRLHGRGVGEGQQTDLRVRLAQLEVNAAIDPAAFTLVVPNGAAPITLDDLRGMAPLGGPEAGRQ